MMSTTRAYIKRADKARNFPTNTCPASRHAQIIGEMLIQKKSYPMLHEEPEHCGETILSVVTSLYLARTEIEKLKKKLSRGKEERAKVLAALNIGRIVAQDDDGNYTREITPKRITEAIAIMRKEPQGWMPIETAPQSNIVLVYYTNSLGNGRTMRARYYPPDTLESETNESGWADEGWYEESEAYEYLMPLDQEPTHWMPLPPPPALLEKAR